MSSIEENDDEIKCLKKADRLNKQSFAVFITGFVIVSADYFVQTSISLGLSLMALGFVLKNGEVLSFRVFLINEKAKKLNEISKIISESISKIKGD